ncbi:hypothetical protein, partial [Campylobacter troglodytis]|uniref:hypothetical protein n=1 Tax=Campylobacter troglodytis TaxID=654363 RepID=UPI00115A68E8
MKQEGLKFKDSLNSQEGLKALNKDENLIINSQKSLKFTQTQEAMKQKSLKFKEAQERMRYEFFNHL